MSLTALLGLLLALPLFAADPPPASAKYFAGLDLVDQDGNAVDLYSLMKGRTIVMHSFFATCTASCPVMTRTLAAVQERFPDRLGKDLVLVSITVDPANDTPARLKAYAKGLNAGRGWYFLTGTKEQVDKALRRIGQYAEVPEAHQNLIVVGNDATGLWNKALGMASTADILAIVDEVLNDRARLTPQQERGKAIYLRGQSAALRPLTAILGRETDAVPAAVVPCGSCHGEDGQGRAEGGVRPADLTPEALARATSVNGRTRPAYSRPLLKRAITMGFDSGGRELGTVMPRYRMSMAEADDLLAYLEVVGHEPPPGVTDDALRIKVVGETGTLPSAQLYGRQLQFVREGEVFLTIDASDDTAPSLAAAERDHIPTILVQTPEPLSSRYAFSLTAGEEAQRAALRTYARGQESVFVDADCTAALGRAAARPRPPLVLMTSTTAKTCDLMAIPPALDGRVVVASPLPPSAEARQQAATAAVVIVTKLLAQLGRDVTRSELVDALEHVYHVDTHRLPPITWEANRHTGMTHAWLMTLDVATQTLLARPGWIDGDPGS